MPAWTTTCGRGNKCVRRASLRCAVGDRLHALLRGDLRARYHLGKEDYGPILEELSNISAPPSPLPQGGLPDARGSASQGRRPPSPTGPRREFTHQLETFTQLVAASIMINQTYDATARGESAGEISSCSIKKTKGFLVRTLHGAKFGDFQKEVARFGMIRNGEDVEEDDVGEREGSQSSECESESESEGGDFQTRTKAHRKKPSTGMPTAEEVTRGESPTVSSLSQDGFSASAATSSKHQKKMEKKRLKKERKREKRRMKKEKRRREKEDRKRQKRKMEKEDRKMANPPAKKLKTQDGHDKSALSLADEELCHTVSGGDADESTDLQNNCVSEDLTPCDTTNKANFEKHKKDVLRRVPHKVKSRFREGGFSRWRKSWLPVLELGPFDVEPGPVRDMWLEMFDSVSILNLCML